MNEIMALGILWFKNARAKRRILHQARCAERRERKLARAKRNKRVRPIVRFTPTGFFPIYEGKDLFGLMVQVGNDTETYEPEAVMRAAEEARRHEDEYDEFLLEEATNYAPTDYGDEPLFHSLNDLDYLY